MAYDDDWDFEDEEFEYETQVDGLDMETLLERFDYDEEIVLDALKSYADPKNTLAILERIRVFDENDLENYTISVHGIKGSSYNISAMTVGKVAEELQHAAEEKDLDFIQAHHAAFISMTGDFIEELNDLIKEISGKLG